MRHSFRMRSYCIVEDPVDGAYGMKAGVSDVLCCRGDTLVLMKDEAAKQRCNIVVETADDEGCEDLLWEKHHTATVLEGMHWSQEAGGIINARLLHQFRSTQ
ncbi:hypothetical protein NDU88_001213 [Pleurodeles waltl]|uniref:Uncharacterized protein n=1 Tax=Pleurodeles waltl TaxID=8319 RepID=A0AAV7MKD3_PLEWA|nr:hypothetical protein NDU88_001213 [Pleurodeles waltl]